MVEKVAKISRVNTLSYDVHQGLGTGDRDANEKEFNDKLAQAIHKKRASSAIKESVPDPYQVDVQRVTQSLFYDSDVTLDVLKKFHNDIR